METDMRVAVYSITRDRLDYTKVCFESLHEKAGYPFDHYVIDNGSEDNTVTWLQTTYYKQARAYIPLSYNRGISKACNIALDRICNSLFYKYDLIIKFDNDCLVKSENIIGQIVEIYSELNSKFWGPKLILSPAVEGISRQPTRGRHIQIAGRTIGLTAIVGGLFHCVPAEIYARYKYPTDLPLAKGQDDHLCHWFKQNGGEVGYIEGLKVEHYETTDGQAKRYPEYFERKRIEETTTI